MKVIINTWNAFTNSQNIYNDTIESFNKLLELLELSINNNMDENKFNSFIIAIFDIMCNYSNFIISNMDQEEVKCNVCPIGHIGYCSWTPGKITYRDNDTKEKIVKNLEELKTVKFKEDRIPLIIYKGNKSKQGV